LAPEARQRRRAGLPFSGEFVSPVARKIPVAEVAEESDLAASRPCVRRRRCDHPALPVPVCRADAAVARDARRSRPLPRQDSRTGEHRGRPFALEVLHEVVAVSGAWPVGAPTSRWC
jgi:hypothetical protein